MRLKLRNILLNYHLSMNVYLVYVRKKINKRKKRHIEREISLLFHPIFVSLLPLHFSRTNVLSNGKHIQQQLHVNASLEVLSHGHMLNKTHSKTNKNVSKYRFRIIYLYYIFVRICVLIQNKSIYIVIYYIHTYIYSYNYVYRCLYEKRLFAKQIR